MCTLCIKLTFLLISLTFSSGGALVCGARRGPRVLTTQVSGPAGLRGAWSGRSKSRDLACKHGITFRLAGHRRTMETPQLKFFFFCSAAAVACLHHTVPQPLKFSALWQPWYHSSRTSSSICDGHGRCIRMCVSAPCFLST